MDILRKSFDHLLKRHQVLRVNIYFENDKVWQRVNDSMSLNFEVIDLSEEPKDEAEKVSNEYCVNEARKPFDLTKDGLLRVRLIKVGIDNCLLLLAFPSHSD